MLATSLLVVKESTPLINSSLPAERTLILLLAIPVGAFLIDFCLSNSVFGYAYRLFVAPGVVVHEISHALACLVTGAKIHAFSIFDKTGGKVEHYRPKIPIIGQMLISFAPFIGGGVTIFLLAKIVGFNEIDPVQIAPNFDGLKNAVSYLISSVDYRNYQNIILIYFLVSVAVTMNPSTQDIRNILLTLIFFALVAVGIWRFTNFRPDVFGLIAKLPHQLVVVLATIDLVLLLSLILSIIIFAISKIIKPV